MAGLDPALQDHGWAHKAPAHDDLELRVSPSGGAGVFARRAFARGEFVVELTGIVLPEAQVGPQYYAVKVGEDAWLCSTGETVDDFLNHSCAPNLGFAAGVARLHALREIAAGEELAWDYSTAMAFTAWSMECRCGALACRGRVTPFDELAPGAREQLLPWALEYIRRRYGGPHQSA